MIPSNSLQQSLVQLASLAEVEQTILKLKGFLVDAPKEIETLEEQHRLLTERLSELKVKIEEYEAFIRSLEKEIAATQTKIKTKEARIHELKNNKEYHAAQREIAELKSQKQDLETNALESIESLELSNAKLPVIQEEWSLLNEKLEKSKSRIDADLAAALSTLEQNEKTREEVLRDLDRGLVSQYQRILQRRKPALALLIGGTCQACYIHIPSQLAIEVTKSSRPVLCPSCNRILYLP